VHIPGGVFFLARTTATVATANREERAAASNLSTAASPGGAQRQAVPRMQVAIPEPPAPLVEIARLNRILDAGTLGPVTLVSAPAGWGKTVAICSWLRRGGVVGPVAWLTLERNDDGEQF